MRTHTLKTVFFQLEAILAGAVLFACGKYYVEESLPDSITLDAGTELTVSPTRDLSPLDEEPENKFAAVLTEPIVYREDVIAPKGSPVRGEVVLTTSPDGENDRIALRLNVLTVHGGNEVAIETDTVYKFSPVRDPIEPASEPVRAPVVTEADTLNFKLVEPVTFAFIPDDRQESL